MSTNGLIDMTREPWDPERFANCGCLAQLIDGPCNGEVVRFFPGKKVLEIRLNDPKQKFTEQELTKTSTPFKTVEYRLEFFESEGGRTANVIGIWTGSKSGSDWRRLLDDARDYRQMTKSSYAARLVQELQREKREQADRIKVLEALLAKPEPKHPKQTSQTIKALFQVEDSMLSKTLAGIEAEILKKLETGEDFTLKIGDKKPKQDTPAPKEDTGDGTYSTSA